MDRRKNGNGIQNYYQLQIGRKVNDRCFGQRWREIICNDRSGNTERTETTTRHESPGIFYYHPQKWSVFNRLDETQRNKKIEYLGFSIGENSIISSDEKIKAVNEYPVPTNKKELKSYSWFGQFVSQANTKFRRYYGNIVPNVEYVEPATFRQVGKQSA